MSVDGWGGRRPQYNRFSLHIVLICELICYNLELFLVGSIMFVWEEADREAPLFF